MRCAKWMKNCASSEELLDNYGMWNFHLVSSDADGAGNWWTFLKSFKNKQKKIDRRAANPSKGKKKVHKTIRRDEDHSI